MAVQWASGMRFQDSTFVLWVADQQASILKYGIVGCFFSDANLIVIQNSGTLRTQFALR